MYKVVVAFQFTQVEFLRYDGDVGGDKLSKVGSQGFHTDEDTDFRIHLVRESKAREVKNTSNRLLIQLSLRITEGNPS